MQSEQQRCGYTHGILLCDINAEAYSLKMLKTNTAEYFSIEKLLLNLEKPKNVTHYTATKECKAVNALQALRLQ